MTKLVRITIVKNDGEEADIAINPNQIVMAAYEENAGLLHIHLVGGSPLNPTVVVSKMLLNDFQNLINNVE